MKQKDLDAMLDELVKEGTPEEIRGESGLVKELTRDWWSGRSKVR